MGLGSPLQRIAMGLVIVVLDVLVPADPHPTWARWDALPDPLGWVLVVVGAQALARADDRFSPARWLAVLAGVVSVPVWVPQVLHLLGDSGEWAASLPQLLFCVVLVREIGLLGAAQRPRDAYAAQRAGLLVWGLALVAVLPVVVLGARVTALEAPTQALAALVNVALVWFVFRVHRRTWLGGPGPLEVQAPAPGTPGTPGGRPPR